ncbi:hypothetical protein HDU84_005971 [Entophlyctis sp. JEL0112]|nr:hypothetical protein HDU84_005971 [Entophlyctis sp. JEL0112]
MGPFRVAANSVVDWSGLKSGTTITLTGTMTFAKGMVTTSDHLITGGGSAITFSGTGNLYGSREDNWDGEGSSGVNKQSHQEHTRPLLQHLEAARRLMASPSKILPATRLGHTTDGFDVSASGITMENCNMHNQDYCFAVNSVSEHQIPQDLASHELRCIAVTNAKIEYSTGVGICNSRNDSGPHTCGHRTDSDLVVRRRENKAVIVMSPTSLSVRAAYKLAIAMLSEPTSSHLSLCIG